MKTKNAEGAPFDLRFERSLTGYIATNPFGSALRLTASELGIFKTGRAKPGSALFKKLAAGGFINSRLDMEGLAAAARRLSGGVFSGPGLHILVLTLRCNHSCVYCRATALGAGKDSDMSGAIAERSVDTAFDSPSGKITLEFQGGEALLNWPVLVKTVRYAKKLNATRGKDLQFSVVTNLSLMDEEKARFLSAEGVSVCASLDGPSMVHDANRRWSGGSSHARAVNWLKRFMSLVKKDGSRDSLPSALMTTTRTSLGHHKAIVDEYRSLGLGGIFIRPLSPIGYCASVWPEIGYTPDDFMGFYRRAMKYIMDINRAGEKFVERNAALLSRKILKTEDPDYLDLRSPCGAAVGQLAYNFNGDVYTCDEGRMVAACGDDLFRLGNVKTDAYRDLAAAPAARLCCMASCLESQPFCGRCAYKPYCGVCPVHNYATQGSPWGDMRSSSWCALQKGFFKVVFELLEKRDTRKIIEGWLEKENPENVNSRPSA